MHEARVILFERDRLELRFAYPAWRAERREVPAASVLHSVRELAPLHCQRVLVAGGAPLDHPRWREVVDACAALEGPRVGLEAAAADLRPDLVDELARRGVADLFLYVGGHSSAAQTAVLRTGSREAADAGLRAAAQSGMRVYVAVPLVSTNADEIDDVVSWTMGLGGSVAGLLLALPEIERARESARTLLGYRRQAAIAAGAFRRCRDARLEYGFTTKRGVLPCAAGEELESFATVFYDRITYLRGEEQHGRKAEFARIRACTDCSLTGSCAGVEPAYLAAFGDAEMESVPLRVSSGWKLKPINRLETHQSKHVSPFTSPGESRRMALLRVNGHCNMSCSFCFVDRTVGDSAASDLQAEVSRLRAMGYGHLVLSGGEPTIHPDLLEVIATARREGFECIELQTNGVRSSDVAYARELTEAGLNEVCISLHHVDPATSDEITRLAQAFPKTVQALHNFRRLGVQTKIAHVITRLNYATLPDFVRFVDREFPAAEGHRSICFGFVQPMNDLVFDWVIPRFAEVKPFFREALEFCLREGIGFGGMLGQGGCPPCLLDGEMKFYEMNLPNIFRSPEHDRDFYKAERCRECSFDPHCVGVRRHYVEMYGDAELVPFRAEIAAPPDLARPRRALPVRPS